MLQRGGYDVDAITVEQLLTHTSGLSDYASGDAEAPYAESPYIAAVLSDPTHRWTRLEQVQFAMDHAQPVGNPGQKYRYSDTGYVLLGEIVERASGKSLGLFLR